MDITHSDKALLWIKNELNYRGVSNYRFCIENDNYVCDEFGIFYSVCKRQKSKSGRCIEKYRLVKLKGSMDKYGYITYRINVNGIKKHLKAHRMMLDAWKGVCENKVVNHIDGNKQNNRLSNLEWCTVAENNAHAINTGLYDPHMNKCFSYKIPTTEWVSIYILYKHCGYSLSRLGRAYGCSHDTIKNVVKKLNKIMPAEVLYA